MSDSHAKIASFSETTFLGQLPEKNLSVCQLDRVEWAMNI
jgi:hypothetical protein